MNKVTILLEDGEKIQRKVKLVQFGNFVMAVVRYKNREYLLKEWEGDEYLRPEGIREIYTLGRRLRKMDKQAQWDIETLQKNDIF